MVRDRLIDNGREERRLLWPRMCIGLNKDFSHFFLLSAFYRYSTDLESDTLEIQVRLWERKARTPRTRAIRLAVFFTFTAYL